VYIGTIAQDALFPARPARRCRRFLRSGLCALHKNQALEGYFQCKPFQIGPVAAKPAKAIALQESAASV
jgi:hypothetical protein